MIIGLHKNLGNNVDYIDHKYTINMKKSRTFNSVESKKISFKLKASFVNH